MLAFEAGLRFLRTPGDLGLTAGDVITFTAVFTAEAVVVAPTPTYNQWKRYAKPVAEDPDTYLPTPEDFGGFDGYAEDGNVLIEAFGFENSVVGFRTWIYRWEPLEHDVGVAGDDGVALYANEKFVAGRPNAEDPMAFDTLFLGVGWNKLEALVFNGPGHIRLELSEVLGRFGVMDANASYDSPPPRPIPPPPPPVPVVRSVTIMDGDDNGLIDMLSDTAIIHMENVPFLPPDRVYEGWFVSDDGARKESTGILEVRPGDLIEQLFQLTETENSITFDLDELNASGQSGTATLTQVGADLLVELFLPAGALETELVHIHSGQCGPDLLGVEYPLTSFVGGSGPSVTVVEGLSLNNLRTGNFAINAHQTQNPAIYTACGGIPGGTLTGENLFADFDKFVVTIEPVPDPDPGPSSDVAFVHQIPAGGMVHIRHLLFSWQGNPPYTSGFHLGVPKGIVVGLREQTGVALLHAGLAVDSTMLAEVHQHAEHVVNIIEGSGGPNYGDLDGNGAAENPGDGFGVLSYAEDAMVHAELATAAAPDDPVIRELAPRVIELAATVQRWAFGAQDEALAALSWDNVDKARDNMKATEAILSEAIGAARRAYLEAQNMGTYVLEPAVGPPTIVFADLDWDTAQIQNAIARIITEHGYGYPTEAIPGSSMALWDALLEGKVDVFMEAWLPNMQDLWDRAIEEGLVVDLGKSLDDNWQSAFVVPSYVIDGDPDRGILPMAPDLVTVQDIRRHTPLFADADSGGKAVLVSCLVRWQCSKTNEAQVIAYGLDDVIELRNPPSAAALDASLLNAYEKGDPWLGYTWEARRITMELDLTRLVEPECVAEQEPADGCVYPDAPGDDRGPPQSAGVRSGSGGDAATVPPVGGRFGESRGLPCSDWSELLGHGHMVAGQQRARVDPVGFAQRGGETHGLFGPTVGYPGCSEPFKRTLLSGYLCPRTNQLA